MKCPHCGMTIEGDQKKCPYCYGALECGDPEQCQDEQATTGNRKSKRKYIPLVCAAAVLVIAMVAFLLPSGLFSNPDAVVAEYNGSSLTNRQLNYYYWSDYYYYLNNYGTSSFDPSTALSEQAYDEETTWQDYFIQSAVENWRDIMAVRAIAEAEGFVLPDEYQAELDGLQADLEEAAASMNMSTAKDYLKYAYGSASDYESFHSFIENNYIASAYSDAKYEELDAQYSVLTGQLPTINIRHILIGTDSFEDAKATADEVYQTYLDGAHTEEAFAELANQHSTDPGSNTNGGLYTNVMAGDMVAQFNDWCFDANRAVGDTGIVETQFGYHIMYFCGSGEPQSRVDSSATIEMYTQWLDGITADPLDIHKSEIEIYQ